MKKLAQLCALVFTTFTCTHAAATKPPGDPFGRDNPRSTVTNFLEACQGNQYGRAAQYLDVSRIAVKDRAREAPQLARQLEAILNSDSHFEPVRLSQSPEGNPADSTNPTLELVTTIDRNGKSFPIQLEREQQGALQVWVFSSQSVSEIPGLVPSSTESAIEARLPRVFVQVTLLDTPLWKWIALLAAAIVVFLIFRLVAQLLTAILQKLENRHRYLRRWHWMQAILDPAVIFCAVVAFRVSEEVIDPSALARIYIGRFLILVVTASVAWGLVNLVDVFITRLDRVLNTKHRVVSESMIYLGRRFFKTMIVCFAAVTILGNWGYDMTTIVAGLGVGGIAVALAAQSTIANVFGGVSVIGDAPVTVGDFGNFGGVIGTVQDIGMRSTRIRTLSRTVMAIPNSSFAGMNLENYSLRDKILFNPTFQIKRGTPKDQIRYALAGIQDALSKNKMVELGPTPIRITALSGASFAIEVFAYVLTPDIDEFYKVEAELFLAVDEALASSNVELA